MQEHNTVQLSSKQYSDIVKARKLMTFFIKLLDHHEVSVFELERESLVYGLTQVKGFLESGTTSPNISPGQINWKNTDPKYSKTPWSGWYFKDGLLWDEDGNHYTPVGVKGSWQSEMIINGKIGSKSNIRTMKDHLVSLKKEQELKSITVLINGEKVVFTPD